MFLELILKNANMPYVVGALVLLITVPVLISLLLDKKKDYKMIYFVSLFVVAIGAWFAGIYPLAFLCVLLIGGVMFLG